MKKFTQLFIAALLLSLFSSLTSQASHLMGGEISWRCTGTGSFIFKMKIYRDCNGIPFGPPVSLDVHNYPGLTTIPLNLVSQSDISSYATCDSCAGSTGTSIGAVEELIFESSPIQLTGTPPAQGWVFSFSSCCRNATISNIQNPSSYGFSLRAIMYSVNGQSVSPCFDSSPDFAERPSSATAVGYNFLYTPFATDNELDSIVYSWDAPLDSWGGGTWSSTNPPTIPYIAGCNPFPMPATLNPLTGEISCVFPMAGVYNAVNKVSSYKCGVLSAEIYRDMQFAVIATSSNNHPAVTPPFFDSITSLPTFYDTVYAGDLVTFPINAIDPDFQNVTLEAAGNQFGGGFTDTSSGCLIPPCATLNPPPPLTSPFVAATTFQWQTTNDHLGMNYICAYMPNTYYFLIRAKDDFCPVHAFQSAVIVITVLPSLPKPTVIQSNDTLMTAYLPGYDYQWYQDRFKIAGANSNSYKPTVAGDYQVRLIENSTGSGNYSEGFKPIVTSINETFTTNSSLSISPNPGNGIFKVSNLKTGHFELSFTDMIGNVVYHKIYSNFNSNSIEIDLKNVDNGVYLFHLKSDNLSGNTKVIISK